MTSIFNGTCRSKRDIPGPLSPIEKPEEERRQSTHAAATPEPNPMQRGELELVELALRSGHGRRLIVIHVKSEILRQQFAALTGHHDSRD